MSLYSRHQQKQQNLFEYDPSRDLEEINVMVRETWRKIARAWEGMPEGWVKTLLFRKIHADKVINRMDRAVTEHANKIGLESLPEEEVRKLVRKCREALEVTWNRVQVLGGSGKG